MKLDAGVQAVGDALSGLLMVEAALRRRQWGLQQWAELYSDLPSRQSKVQVADRSVITTTNAETKTTSPAGLQALIDSAVAGGSWQSVKCQVIMSRDRHAHRHCSVPPVAIELPCVSKHAVRGLFKNGSAVPKYAVPENCLCKLCLRLLEAGLQLLTTASGDQCDRQHAQIAPKSSKIYALTDALLCSTARPCQPLPYLASIWQVSLLLIMLLPPGLQTWQAQLPLV